MTKEEWKKQNKERERLNNQRWYQENKSQVRLRKAEYYEENSEKEKARSSNWKKNNSKKISALRKSDPSKRIAANIRSSVSSILSGKQKTSKTEQYLSCTFEELKIYLESKFLPDMTWENYGLKGWHIDHIKPLALFDLTDETQLKQAWHFTNLRPLWARDNLSKGKKF